MFEDLKMNISQEKKIVADMIAIESSMTSDAGNQSFYLSSLNSLVNQLRLLNAAVPDLLKEWSPVAGAAGVAELSKKSVLPLKAVVPKPKIVRMSYISPATKEKRYVTINKADKKEFLKKLKLSEASLLGIKKMQQKNSGDVVQKPSKYAAISNRLFRNTSDSMASQFGSLSQDLKKANVRFLISTYISIAIFSSMLALIVGVVIYAALLALDLSYWTFIWIPLVTTGLTMMAFYFYPSTEAGSVQKKISQELPFATIHMAAIAGSNIEPTKIFKIIAMSKEYVNVGREIRKVITQVEIYGYDLVTSLKNVAARTSNKKLAELFSGLASNISTGGELKSYLEKKAENFLLDYKLERQKYSDLAGTFMDVYISILIAAPLVLMMMFIVMNVAGLGLAGLSITSLLSISIAGIIVINIVFMIVLNMKQPAV